MLFFIFEIRVLGLLKLSKFFHLLTDEDDDDMYEFTPEDYYRILGPKKQGDYDFN